MENSKEISSVALLSPACFTLLLIPNKFFTGVTSALKDLYFFPIYLYLRFLISPQAQRRQGAPYSTVE